MKRLLSFLILVGLMLTAVPAEAEAVPEGDYGVHYVKYGDLNLDNQVDAGDALEVLRIVVDKSTVEDRLFPAADVDGQEGIGATDGLRILQFSVNKLKQFVSGVYVTVHVWDVWETVTPATQTAQGLQRRDCLLCEAYEEKILPVISQEIGEFQMEILRLVNEERAKAGVPPLAYYTQGQKLADLRADEVAVFYSHDRPDGSSCFTVLEGIPYFSAGENIAMGQVTPQEVMEDWMNSQGHRENILNEWFTHLLVGATPATQPGYRGYAWVQLFMGMDI